jgi:photosystem II stability/assembly factor-like uncharacterized protein
MKSRAPFVAMIALVVALQIAGRARVDHPRAEFDAPDAAMQYEAARRAPVGSTINVASLYARADVRRAAMSRFASGIGRMLPAALPVARTWLSRPTSVLDAWTPLGPGNIGGRTRVIRYHPTRHTSLFAAGVSGGIWRSDDDGVSWQPTGDGLANLAVNSLAIDPQQPDVMYAGTGEGYFREEIRGTGLPLRGSGIFVTRDGGSTWQRLSETLTDDFLWVNDLELGIGDSRRIYAATRTGVFRSSDGGATWTQLLATSVRGGCLDLAIRPDRQDDVLFASCGSYEQATVYRFPAASRAGAPETVLQESDMGRTSLAIAPSNPDVVYALAASNDPGPGGNYRQGLLAVYRSDRGGAAGTWQTRVTNSDSTRLNTLLLTNIGAATAEECGAPAGRNSYPTMGWYNNVIAVDPLDPDRVWAAGVDWLRSDDGGRTWGLASFMTGPPGAATGVHVDQHAIVFHPDYNGDDNQIAIVANDGGLARTLNARGRTSSGARAACAANISALDIRWESLNHGYGVTQFYHGLPFASGESYFGGSQDNSTLVGSDQMGPDGWRSVIGGDGGYVAFSPANPRIMYGETQWANVVRSVDGGGRFTSATLGLDPIRSSGLEPDANYLFVSPFVMDPSEPNRLWLGGEYLYRTSDGAALWTKVSTAMPDGGLVSTIAISPTNPNRVGAGTNKGDVVSSRAALSATASTEWEVTRPRDGWITSVAFDPANATTIYATYGNFGAAHIFRTIDDGATWKALDGTDGDRFPDIPVHCIVIDPDDPDRLYVGSDLGVFVSIDRGATWMVEETGFGPAVTEWLALGRDGSGRKRLFAFTHGRGAWRVDLR